MDGRRFSSFLSRDGKRQRFAVDQRSGRAALEQRMLRVLFLLLSEILVDNDNWSSGTVLVRIWMLFWWLFG